MFFVPDFNKIKMEQNRKWLDSYHREQDKIIQHNDKNSVDNFQQLLQIAGQPK